MENRFKEHLRKLCKKVFKPRVVLGMVEWMEKYVILDKKTSDFSGRYSFSRTPYWRGVIEAVEDKHITKIAIKKSAQVGATQLICNIIYYWVCNYYYPILYVMPNLNSCKQLFERSIHPTILSSPEIKKQLSTDKDDTRKTEINFKSCILKAIGGGSAAALASNPAQLAIGDECSKFADLTNEADVISLLEDRCLSFPQHKIILTSTPTTEGSCEITKQYNLGSQSKYFVACPKCSCEQVLEFTQLKWEEIKTEDGLWDVDKASNTTYYECLSCKGKLNESDKIAMVETGKWKETNPNAPKDFKSFHISSMYSFNLTWAKLVRMFLIAKGDLGTLQNFQNSLLGETWKVYAETVKEEAINEIIKLSPKYSRGELLRKPLVIIGSVDTQGESFWYSICAIYEDDTMALIDWGELATKEDIQLKMDQQYRIRDSDEFIGVYKAFVDSGGNRTQEIYEWTIKNPKFIPIKGRGEVAVISPISEGSGEIAGRKIIVMHINKTYYMDALLLTHIKYKSGKLLLPQDSDSVLKLHLTSTKQIEKNKKKEWICTNKQNHLLDTLRYALAFKDKLQPVLEQMKAQGKRQYTLKPR